MNEKLEAVKRERPNVVGYSADLLPRIKGGQEIPGTRCHRIYLSRKLPKDRLPPDALVPISIDGVETDCVVIGELFIASLLPIAVAPTPYTERRDTLIGGISIGHGTITAGTLGAFVKRASQDFMLTNWHVAVGEQGKVGDIIYQPGPYDIQQVYGEEPSEKYAAGLLESFVFPRFGVDAALVVPTRAYDRDAFLSPMALSGIREPAVGMAVLKEGRTTGVTRGIVTDVAAVLSVSYGGSIGSLTLDHLVVIQGSPYLQGGDSGSVTREDSGAPGEQAAVGLNFAGSLQGYGIASPMSRVAQELGFSIGSGGAPMVYAPSNVIEVTIEVKAPPTAVATFLEYFRTDKAVYTQADVILMEGRLVEQVSKAPIAGVNVRVAWSTTQSIILTTDANGVLKGSLSGLPIGTYTLRAQFVG